MGCIIIERQIKGYMGCIIIERQIQDMYGNLSALEYC